MKKGLIIVDYQNDFVKPDGALSVPDADAVYDYILKMIKFVQKDRIIATADVHNEEEWEKFSTPESKKFPRHCVRETEGCELFGELKSLINAGNIFEKTAYAPDKSAFCCLEECDKIYAVGVVTEICVYQTVIALYTAMANMSKFPEIVVDLNGCSHLNEAAANRQMQYLKDYLGVTVIERV